MLRSSLDFVRPFPWQNIKPASLQAHPGEAQIFQVARSESPALKSSTGCALATRRRLARVNEKITDAAADCGRGESSDGWPRVTRNRWRNPDAHEEFTAPDSALEGPILKASFQLHFNFQDEERMLPLELIFRQLQHTVEWVYCLFSITRQWWQCLKIYMHRDNGRGKIRQDVHENFWIVFTRYAAFASDRSFRWNQQVIDTIQHSAVLSSRVCNPWSGTYHILERYTPCTVVEKTKTIRFPLCYNAHVLTLFYDTTLLWKIP